MLLISLRILDYILWNKETLVHMFAVVSVILMNVDNEQEKIITSAHLNPGLVGNNSNNQHVSVAYW